MHCEKCGNELETIYLGLRHNIPCSQPCRRCEFEKEVEIKSVEINNKTHKEHHEELEFWRDMATKSLELAEQLDKENRRLNKENVKLRFDLFENKIIK